MFSLLGYGVVRQDADVRGYLELLGQMKRLASENPDITKIFDVLVTEGDNALVTLIGGSLSVTWRKD
jgi:hypothetical protein